MSTDKIKVEIILRRGITQRSYVRTVDSHKELDINNLSEILFRDADWLLADYSGITSPGTQILKDITEGGPK